MATGTLYYGLSVTDLEDRLSAAKVIDILDDNNNGSADTTPVLRLLLDAQSYIEGRLRGIYPIAVLRAASPAPNELVRLILDRAQGCAYGRHPEDARFDGDKLLARVERELVLLRKGESRLDVDDLPEPAANQGGTVGTSANDPDFPGPLVIYYNQGTGYF